MGIIMSCLSEWRRSAERSLQIITNNIHFFTITLSLAALLSMGYAPAFGQTKIMPLGNSLTDGDGSSHQGGYRLYLYNLLTNAGYSFDFVGSLTGGTGFADTDHEGHAGLRADQLDVTAYLTANPADVVLLEIGTNDVSQNENATQVRDDISGILDLIQSLRPSATTYLSTVLPRKDSASLQGVTEQVNALLPALVNTKASAGQSVKLVDVADRFLSSAGWESTLMSNVNHPNDAGYELMAQEFFNAMFGSSGATEFFDDFNTSPLSADWSAHPAFQVLSGQLVNTSTTDAWDNHLAVPTTMVNPNVLELKYGSLSDAVGRDFTGAGLMLNNSSTTASGYLLVKNGVNVRLFTIENGVPAQSIGSAAGSQPAPAVGDVLRVEWNSDGAGHHFFVYLNGQFDGSITDPNKLQGSSVTQYAGVMVNGNTNDGVDEFYLTRAVDSAPPAVVQNLNVTATTSASATLEWTAPGDDGNSGTARSYDLRFSTSPIDEGNFSGATPASGIGNPKAAGQTESWLVGGLQSGTRYYFALRSSDEVGNQSNVSNVVSTTTITLNIASDGFNRAGPALGENWAADSRMQIINNAVQNTAALDIWTTAVYKKARNAQEVTIKWAAEATGYGANFSGILVKASAFSATPNGYLVQHYSEQNKVRLWHIQNGEIAGLVDEGTGFGPHPAANSEMKVIIYEATEAHYFDVYVNGQFDRTLRDGSKRENGTYSGFVLESTLGDENAITRFDAGVQPGEPKALQLVSGNNQSGRVGEILPQPLKVSLLDEFDNPIPSAPINFTAIQGQATFSQSDDNIRMEAEAGEITAPLVLRDNAEASGGKYLLYPSSLPEAGSAVYRFYVSEAGKYYVWTRSLTPGSTNNDSWTVHMDGEAPFTYDVFQSRRSNVWAWDLLSKRGSGSPIYPEVDPKTYNLDVGFHSLVFEGRWTDTWLDKLLITSDANYVPAGKEDSGSITDTDGLAATQVTLGGTAGPVTVHATYAALSPAVFNLTAKPGAPHAFAQASGSGQSGPPGTALPQPFTLVVLDTFNNPSSNAQVSWVVTKGNGKLSSYRTLSDANGVVSVSFLPGNQGAENKAEALGAFTSQAVEFVATTTSAVGASVERVSGSDQTGTVHSALAAPLILQVKNSNGGNVANYPVEFEVTRGGGKTSGLTSVLNAGFESASNGRPLNWNLEGSPSSDEVQISSESPRSGSNSIQVATSRASVGISQELTYEANANHTLSFWAKVDSGILRVLWRMNDDTGNPRDLIIDVTPEATRGGWRFYSAREINGTAGKRNLFLRSVSGGRFKIDDVRVIRNTNNDGRLALTWTLGDTAGTQHVSASAPGAQGQLPGSPIVFNANARPAPAATLLAASGNGQLGSAGQPLAAPFVAKVADTYGNGVSRVNVLFEVTAGNGTFTDGSTSKTVQADTFGLAQITPILGPTAGVENKVRATSSGLSGSPVVFTATAAIPSKLVKVAGDGQIATAGATVEIPLTSRITNDNGNPVSGVAVIFEVTQGNGKINGGSTAQIRTDAQGDARAFLVSDPVAGAQNRLRASASYNGQALQGSPNNFQVRTAALSEMTTVAGNNQTGFAGDQLVNPFKVMIKDTLSHGVPQQEVRFTVIEGNGKLNGGSNTAVVKTDSTGVASVRLTLGNQPGTDNNKVRAEAASALPGSPFVFQASAKAGPPSMLVKVSGDSVSGVVNNSLGQPFLTRVTDKVGNLLLDIDVIFTVTTGGGNLDGATKDTVKTNAEGLAGVTLTLGASTGLYNNKVQARAFNGSLELTNSPLTFVATAAPSRARNIAMVSGNRQTGLAGEPLSAPVRVKVTDAQGNPINTHPVRFRSTGIPNGTFSGGITDSTVITDSNGIASLIWILGSAVLPDSQRITISANDGLQNLQGSPMTFVAAATPGLPSATASTISATGPIAANGQSKSAITVVVKDKFGHPISGKAVQMLVSGSDNTIVQPAKTNSQGQTSGTLSSTKAELKTVTAKVDDLYELKPGTTVRFNPLPASQMTSVSGNGQTANVNTALADPLSVRIEDRNKNGVPGVTVQFSIDQGDGRLLDNAAVVSDSNGLASMRYVIGPNLVENRVRAASPGLTNSPIIFVANAVNNQAAKLQSVSGNDQEGVVLEELARPLVVRVVDRDDRAVAGSPIIFSVTFGEGRVNGSSSVTVQSDEFGEGRVNWRLGPNAGLNVVRASANGIDQPVDFQATARTGLPVNLVLQSGDGASGPVNQELATPLVVKVTDGPGSGVDGVPVIFELIRGTGQLSSNLVTTSSGGFASVRITFDRDSGERVVRATANGLNGSPRLFHVFATPTAATAMQAISRTNNQRGTAGLPLNFPLQVKVTDRYGNPISGSAINFVVHGGGGTFEGQPAKTDVTNESGIAEASWTIGSGANQASAIGTGLSGSPLEFVATGVTNNKFPIFTDVPDQTLKEGERIEFVLRASDADNDAIRYGAKNLPPGSVFDSLGTRIFTWSTDENSAGQFEVSFFAYDTRNGYDEELVLINVTNRNRAPVIVSRLPVGTQGVWPDTTLNGGPLTMRVHAEDPDGDVLSYRWIVNGQFTSAYASTFVFSSDLLFNTVEALVFDQEDTARTVWSIKTPVELQSFTAAIAEGNKVKLEWKTGSESAHAGFNVLRSRSNVGPYERINDRLIAPARDGHYSFIDAGVEVNNRYYYKLESVALNGDVTLHGPVVVTIEPPQRFELSQNYPNPFNPTTHIRYQLSKDTQVKLTIFNVLGQVVRELVNERQVAGYYTVIWNGRDEHGRRAPTGVYHYRIEAGEYVAVKKMMLAK